MTPAFHFITGLPRSGSTLLAAILAQNPACWASIITPMGPIVQNLLAGMSPQDETHVMLTEEVRVQIIGAAFGGYHSTHLKPYIFDNNRSWAARAPLLFKIFPKAKMVCLIRPYDEIIDSFERLFREHPTEISKIYGMNAGATVYDRVAWIISGQGVLGYAVNAVNELWSGPHRERVLFVEYNTFANNPDEVMRAIHQFCDMPPFDYNFHKIEQLPGTTEFDQTLGTPGLHTVGRAVRPREYTRCLPENVYQMLRQPFWL